MERGREKAASSGERAAGWEKALEEEAERSPARARRAPPAAVAMAGLEFGRGSKTLLSCPSWAFLACGLTLGSGYVDWVYRSSCGLQCLCILSSLKNETNREMF